jgi:hypothetical protein
MIEQRNRGRVYIVLALATMVAIMSIIHPTVPREAAHFLRLTSAPEAAMAAGAIGEDPGAVAPP